MNDEAISRVARIFVNLASEVNSSGGWEELIDPEFPDGAIPTCPTSRYVTGSNSKFPRLTSLLMWVSVNDDKRPHEVKPNYSKIEIENIHELILTL